MSEISVLIVNWNACAYLRDCLKSIRQTSAGRVREIIVVDNASTDGSLEMVAREFPEVEVVRLAENLGFARGNNAALKLASGAYFALINSDVVVHPGCFAQLSGFLASHPRVGLVGPKVLGRDGDVQQTCGRLPNVWNTVCRFAALDKVFPRWPLFSGFQTRHWDHDRSAEVEMLSGCFWVARRTAVEQVGELDDSFFFYAEDMDWCKRFLNAGWKLVYVPQATATHFGGGSSSSAPLRYSVEMLRANLLYWKKYYGNLGRSVFYVLAILQHFMRFVARGLLNIIGIARSLESKQKLREHMVCLRWLVTGKGV